MKRFAFQIAALLSAMLLSTGAANARAPRVVAPAAARMTAAQAPAAAAPTTQAPAAPRVAEPSARAGEPAPQATTPPAQGATLGIAMSDNTRGGVLILRVLPGSPAAAIGLQTGDRIMAVGGKPVANYRDVARLIASYKPNTRVILRIDRGGWSKSLTVTLGDASVLAVPVASAAPPTTPAPPAVAPGSLLSRPEFIDESPADIDDQHGYGG